MAAHDMTQDLLKAADDGAMKAGKKSLRWMDTAEIKDTWPEFSGSFDGWTSLWSPEAGWV